MSTLGHSAEQNMGQGPLGRGWVQRAVLVGAVLIVVGLAASLGAAWYASGVIGCRLIVPQPGPPDLPVQVVEVTSSTVRLQASRIPGRCGTVSTNWRQAGTWGLYWPGGWGEVGEIRELDEARGVVTRDFRRGSGTPLTGQYGRLESAVYTGGPREALGLVFEDVTFAADSGAMPAWLVPGDRDTWVVLVHGRAGSRRDVLRAVPVLHAQDLPVLVIAYRNDLDAPGGPGDSYGLGASEWPDLEAAVRFAQDRGARHVVLYGFSMGGATSVAFLLESNLASTAVGAILDAPAIDYVTPISAGLRDAGIRGPLVWLSLRVTEFRYRMTFDRVQFGERASELRTPMLLLHGEEDDQVPIAVAERFAAERPDLVTFERFPRANHPRSWNVDRARYEAAVTAFLERVAPH